jgi:dolichyl-diphosphooligosaccharide--protein glycosyltransferase
MDKKIMLAGLLLLGVLIAVFDILIAFIFVIVVAAALNLTNMIGRKDAILAALLFIIFSQLYLLYYIPDLQIAKGQGTVLSDNWYEALNWIKENTSECAVVATYWDPGHFITGIARRPVIFDGASQSELYTRPANYTQAGVVVENYDANIHHIVLYKDGNKTTARIQDASTTLLTSNETLAVDILREYREPGCKDMYYIASADLIPKSTWWTYFSTWNPVDKKGTPYTYSSIALGSARPDIKQNAVVYTYPVSQQQSFILYITNESMIMFLQQQGTAQPIKVEKFVIFDNNGNGRIITQEDAGIQGTVFVEPGNQGIMFIPPELENAMFTRMFLYNGAGLSKFDFVGNWGGELKLFKVVFDDSNTPSNSTA